MVNNIISVDEATLHNQTLDDFMVCPYGRQRLAIFHILDDDLLIVIHVLRTDNQKKRLSAGHGNVDTSIIFDESGIKACAITNITDETHEDDCLFFALESIDSVDIAF